MGAHSRRKGASGEREVAHLFMDQLGVPLRRRLTGFYNSAGSDLEVHIPEGHVVTMADWFVGTLGIEVKRARRVTGADIRAWWKQTFEQAQGRYPVLFYREDQQEWRVVIPGSRTGYEWTYEVHPDCFFEFCREKISASHSVIEKERKLASAN